MAVSYKWRFQDSLRGDKLVNRRLDAFPTLKVLASQLKRCTVCKSNIDTHRMRYRVYDCGSDPCCDSGTICEFRLKTVAFETSQLCHIYQHGHHVSSGEQVKKPKLSRSVKATIQGLVQQDVKPARIRIELIDQLAPTAETLPALKQIQNFVYNYKRSKLSNTDMVEEMIEIAAGSAFSDHLSDNTAFTFGYQVGSDGVPILGDGSDQNPLFIGITTKFLLRVANRDPSSFVFHMDATFKLVLCGYPLMVCGISDSARQFHPVAFFITSQRTVVQYTHALQSLMELYAQVVEKTLAATYIMGDAEDAQYNAFEQTLGVNTNDESPTYLMCFFHVVENVKKRVGGLSNNAKHLVYRLIYEMHYSANEQELKEVVQRAESLWDAVPELHRFSNNFQKTWLKSRFSKWQCFWSPTGYAKTNNPAEQFNKVIKRDYTLRVRMKLCALLQKVISMAQHRSFAYTTFVTELQPARTLISRTKRLMRANKLLVTHFSQSVHFLLSDSSGSTVAYVVGSLVFAGDNAKNAELGERNNGRMERLGQPHEGWTVNVDAKTCPCKVCFKFGYCVHLLASLRRANQRILGWAGTERRFVDRRVKRAQPNGSTPGGRPAVVSHALCVD